MTTLPKIAVAVALATTFTSAAWAGPGPMSEEELFELADVVADVESVSVACAGEPDYAEWATITSYDIELRTLELLKGETDEMIDYRVSSYEYNEEFGLPGCTDPEYVLPQGWVGRVFLTRSGDGYTITYWGGAVIDAEASIQHELPVCEVISPESDPDPETDPGIDPEADPNDPSDPTTSDDGAVAVSGCSMGNDPAQSGWLTFALAAAALAGLRRRRSGS